MKKLMVTFFVLPLLLLVASTSFAAGNQKKTNLAPISELTSTFQSIQDVVINCSGIYYSATILNGMNDSPQRMTKMYAELRSCKDDGAIKIQSFSKFVLDEMGKRKLRELGADYLVQSQTTLEAIENEPLFDNEFSKLKAVRSRIDLELSAQQ